MAKLTIAERYALSLCLIDVGCSGGLSPIWDVFGSRLTAVGFDPLVAEIERLRATEPRPSVRYEAAYVGLSQAQQRQKEATLAALPAQQLFDHDIYSRKSSKLAMSTADYAKQMFNLGSDLCYSDRCLSVDEYVFSEGIGPVHVLKVDTDFCDLEVLMGAEHTLQHCLMVQSEAGFHDPLHPYATSFANIDLYLRSRGFTLYRFDIHRYTRRDLPGQFVYELPAQTLQGPVEWGDVMYARDLAHPAYEDTYRFDVDEQTVLRAACLFELFDLPDCAAELINARRSFFPEHDAMLDQLVPSFLGEGLTYSDYIKRFRQNYKALYPSGQRANVK